MLGEGEKVDIERQVFFYYFETQKFRYFPQFSKIVPLRGINLYSDGSKYFFQEVWVREINRNLGWKCLCIVHILIWHYSRIASFLKKLEKQLLTKVGIFLFIYSIILFLLPA